MKHKSTLGSWLDEPVQVKVTSPRPSDTLLPSGGTVLLCPGQGAQHVGMGQPWSKASTSAKRTFEQAEDCLKVPLSRYCFEGPASQLNRTDVAQAAIYTTTVASYRALVDSGRIGPIAASGGLSLGEWTALHLGGAYGFEQGLQLVWTRGQAMQKAAETQPGGMVVVLADCEAGVVQLCSQVLNRLPDTELLVPANFNCPGQIAISGTAAACEAALKEADQMGMRAKPLTVAGAFHSPLMASAGSRLAEALDQHPLSRPCVPVLSNVTGLPHEADVAQIKRLLVEQLTQPVRWQSCAQWLAAHAHPERHRFVELEPGKVLSGLMRRIDWATKVHHYEPHAVST